MSERAVGLTHEESWELLPWLVNETLEPLERERVEAHLATCADCGAEVERCRSLAALVRSAEVSPSPHPAQLMRLVRRVDEIEGSPRWRGLVGLLGGTPSSVRWALAAQAAAIVLLLAVAFWPGPTRGYRVLSDPPAPAAAGVTAQRQVRVVFTPSTSEAELRRLLLEVRGEVVGGPSSLGTYTIAVPSSGAGAEPLARVLEHLRADPHVRLAEPVAPASGG